MPRIRSTHPEQWTDESFVACSFPARLLSLALRNEADDNGIFEWSTAKIKMRLMPADDVDVGELLGELKDTCQVLMYEDGTGKAWGLIRSFQRFQSPKNPSFKHPTPNQELPKGFTIRRQYTPRRGALPEEWDSDPPALPPGEGAGTGLGTGTGSGLGEEEKSSLPPPTPSQFLNRWNTLVHGSKIPKLREMTPARTKKLNARRREAIFVGNWEAAIGRMTRSKFCQGMLPGKNWVANAGWFLKNADNIAKVIEGTYDDSNQDLSQPGEGSADGNIF